MRTRLICTLTILALVATGTAWGDDKDKKDAEVEKAFSKIAQLGPGVHAIKTDAKGRITSCVIVGQARISTVLGKAKGVQDARDKARLDASAQFVKWLGEKVSVYQKSENETILFIEGSEENDKNTLKESGKAVDKNSKTFTSCSQGQVRALQVLHLEVSDKDKTYTLVMGWSAVNSKATQNIEGNDAKIKNGDLKSPDVAKKLFDKKIDDKKLTSDDAKKFLP